MVVGDYKGYRWNCIFTPLSTTPLIHATMPLGTNRGDSMYITKKFALKKTRLHSDDTYDSDYKKVKAYAPKGTIYYQISNGTIGKGARYTNYSESAMANLINSTPSAWSKGTCIELAPDTSNVFELKPIKPTNEVLLEFCESDLPF